MSEVEQSLSSASALVAATATLSHINLHAQSPHPPPSAGTGGGVGSRQTPGLALDVSSPEAGVGGWAGLKLPAGSRGLGTPNSLRRVSRLAASFDVEVDESVASLAGASHLIAGALQDTARD
ncbi:hypothetical protein T484DRAFT_1761311 [Baffinella frigidus]|nr:hypothetical protein T484DRAFT_1761311 [Cryptophyta sp. CCMP2293]